MEVLYVDLKNINSFKPLVACIGYFDGIHIGHQKLLSETIAFAKQNELKSACITFHPDPWVVIKKIENIPHLSSMTERIEYAERFHLDYWIILPFTEELSQMETKDFELLLSKLNVQKLICGFDFTYGYKGQGNIQSLKAHKNFEVIEVKEIKYLNEKISSTRIENAIYHGDMHLASKLLGRYYSIQGNVVKGSHLGNTIGFPTANIHCKYNAIIPQKGVYIGYINVDQNRYRCMMNVGHNPTFNYQEQISIEAYILDFDEDIYTKEVRIEFVEKIRDEKKFESKEQLILQLNQDIEKAKQL